MTSVLPLMLATSLMAATPAGQAAPDTRTEQGLRQFLDPLEARYEEACVRMNEAWWDLVRSPGETAKDAAVAPLESARRDLAAIYADPALQSVLATWGRRSTVASDPTLTRRIDLWRRSRVAAAIELKPDIFTLAADLTARVMSHRYPLGDRTVTLEELRQAMATSGDRESRHKAWLAETRFAAEIEPDVKKLLRLRAVESQKSDQRYFHHVVYDARGIDPYWAYSMLQQAETRTRPAFKALIESLQKRTGIAPLMPWDLDYAMNAATTGRGLDPALTAVFPSGGALPAAQRLLKALGFSGPEAPIRAETFGLGFGPAFGLAVRIPSDLRVLANKGPVDSGPRYYEAVLREYGRALQSAYNRQRSPMLKGYACVAGPRNGVYEGGMAAALGSFVRDPLFLKEQLGMDGASIRPFLEDEADRSLLRLRELLLNTSFEFVAYVNPDANLDDRYGTLLANFMDVRADAGSAAGWAGRLSFIQEPAADLDALIALTIAPELQDRLKEAFGDQRLRSGKAAAWLIEHCYADGEAVELGDRLQKSIHGGMNLDKYLAPPSEGS